MTSHLPRYLEMHRNGALQARAAEASERLTECTLQ